MAKETLRIEVLAHTAQSTIRFIEGNLTKGEFKRAMRSVKWGAIYKQLRQENAPAPADLAP